MTVDGQGPRALVCEPLANDPSSTPVIILDVAGKAVGYVDVEALCPGLGIFRVEASANVRDHLELFEPAGQAVITDAWRRGQTLVAFDDFLDWRRDLFTRLDGELFFDFWRWVFSTPPAPAGADDG